MGFINPLLIHTHGDQSSAGSICFVHLKQISVTKRVTIATHDSRDVTQSLQCLFIFDRRANIITTRMNLSPCSVFSASPQFSPGGCWWPVTRPSDVGERKQLLRHSARRRPGPRLSSSRRPAPTRLSRVQTAEQCRRVLRELRILFSVFCCENQSPVTRQRH